MAKSKFCVVILHKRPEVPAFMALLEHVLCEPFGPLDKFFHLLPGRLGVFLMGAEIAQISKVSNLTPIGCVNDAGGLQ